MALFQLGGRLLFWLTGATIAAFAAAGDTGNPFQIAVKPVSERLDRSWKRYRNPDLGYCISYPARWSKGPAFDGAGLLVQTGLKRYSKPTGEMDVGPLGLPATEDARIQPVALNENTLRQNVEEHLAGLQRFARAERLEIIDQHTVDLAGGKALYLKSRYYDPLERSTWLEEVVFLNHQGEAYRLEMQCAPDQIRRFEPVFVYLVNSLEFDCK